MSNLLQISQELSTLQLGKYNKINEHTLKVEKLSMIDSFQKQREKFIKILLEIQTDSKICPNFELQEMHNYTLQLNLFSVLRKHLQVYMIVRLQQESIPVTTNHTQ